jgi:hypothetical protein
MTEDEWLACTDPRKMLAFLGTRANKRRLRLFAVAGARDLLRYFRTSTVPFLGLDDRSSRHRTSIRLGAKASLRRRCGST